MHVGLLDRIRWAFICCGQTLGTYGLAIGFAVACGGVSAYVACLCVAETDRWLAPFGGSNFYMPGFGRIGSFLRNIDDEMNTMMQALPIEPCFVRF